MDDDLSILNSLKGQLEHIGASINVSTNGDELIEKLQTLINSENIQNIPDLAILDLTIPGGMGGIDTALAIQKLKLKTKLILSSGYEKSTLEEHPDLFDAVLKKPYTFSELVEKISLLLR
jgi:CheY-like chemotaxis protein